MNQVIIIGNLTKDVRENTSANGTAITSFSIAVNRAFGDKGVDYFDVVTFGKCAENCAKYLAKGKKVGVVGRLQTRSYDLTDGSKRYVTEIVADTVEFLWTASEQPEVAKTVEQAKRVYDDDLPF